MLTAGHRQFLAYLFSGGASTALDILLFALLLPMIGALPAYFTSYLFCLLLRYFWDARVTFRQARTDVAGLGRYLAVTVSLMALGALVFQIAAGYAPPLMAKLLSIPVTVAGGFVLTRHFVFAERHNG